MLPIDLVDIDDRVDAEPGGYAVCKDFDCVIPEIDASDGVIPVPDTKNDRATGGVGEGGEEFVEIAAHFLLKVDTPPFKAGKKGRKVIHETRPHTTSNPGIVVAHRPESARKNQCP
jgi:hypothetical protein